MAFSSFREVIIVDEGVDRSSDDDHISDDGEVVREFAEEEHAEYGCEDDRRIVVDRDLLGRAGLVSRGDVKLARAGCKSAEEAVAELHGGDGLIVRDYERDDRYAGEGREEGDDDDAPFALKAQLPHKGICDAGRDASEETDRCGKDGSGVRRRLEKKCRFYHEYRTDERYDDGGPLVTVSYFLKYEYRCYDREKRRQLVKDHGIGDVYFRDGIEVADKAYCAEGGPHEKERERPLLDLEFLV